jgi:hypothetical protein
MTGNIPNIVRQEDIYRAILEIHKKIESFNKEPEEDKLITVSKIKQLTGIDFNYWMEKIKSGQLKARYFPTEGRKKGGYRVWKSVLVEFIESPLFDPPIDDDANETIYFEPIEDFAKRLIKEIKDAE